MLDKFIDFLLPRIDINNIDNETAEAYFEGYPNLSKKGFIFALVFFTCFATVAFTVFAAQNIFFSFLLSIPSLIFLILTVYFYKVPWLISFTGSLPFLDIVFTIGALLIFTDTSYVFLSLGAYYLSYFVLFIWAIFSYRRKYKKFEELCFQRAEHFMKQRTQKPRYSGILGGVLATAIASILLRTFSVSVIAVGGIYFISFLMVPPLSEVLVVARQNKPMMDKFKPTNVSEL